MKEHNDAQGVSRRGFLGRAGVGTAAAIAASAAAPKAAHAAVSPHTEAVNETRGALPTMRLGEHTITRLVAGYNPIGGYSHCTKNLSIHMREYFTVERTVEFLRHCEASGINAFQFDLCNKAKQALDVLWTLDTQLKFICLNAERSSDASLDEVMKYKPIAVVHHGGVTDSLFRQGKAGQVHDYVKKVHDRGVLAGVSAHDPRNIAKMAEEGWEADLFMTCFHYVTRPREEMEQEFGTYTFGEPFVASDPPRMTEVMRQVDQPCLGFKILAAGRRCNSDSSTEDAFRYAFANIKPRDGVIVGMFTAHRDEVVENAAYARRHGQIPA